MIRRPVLFLMFAAVAVVAVLPGGAPLIAQGHPPVLLSPTRQAAPTARGVASQRARAARANPSALESAAVDLSLFDDMQVTAFRTSVARARSGNGRVWHGVLSDRPGMVTLVEVDGALAGTVFLEHAAYELIPDGDHVVVHELQPAAFPSDDVLDALAVADRPAADAKLAGTTTVTADGLTEIDVMAVWTPAARAATGGTDAGIRSVIELAIANTNLAYANSLVPVTLRLVYAGEIAFTESTSNISGDLSSLAATSDGRADVVHTLRNQYGADVVSLFGAGYTSGSSACGVGYLMGSPSTSFASQAFNVVDHVCAAGNLSYAHEVGHNQGLHHDPPSAAGYGSPAYSYAYGYQDPGGAFRTVLSYGGMTRVPYLSNPSVVYAGRATGTGSQDNARALRGTADVVSAFRGSGSGSTPAPTPSCVYDVTPSSASFDASGGSTTVFVSTTAGCAWTAVPGSSWISVGGGGAGTGSLVLAVAPNAAAPRSGTATVAGVTVSVSQKGVKVRGRKH